MWLISQHAPSVMKVGFETGLEFFSAVIKDIRLQHNHSSSYKRLQTSSQFTFCNYTGFHSCLRLSYQHLFKMLVMHLIYDSPQQVLHLLFLPLHSLISSFPLSFPFRSAKLLGIEQSESCCDLSNHMKRFKRMLLLCLMSAECFVFTFKIQCLGEKVAVV